MRCARSCSSRATAPESSTRALSAGADALIVDLEDSVALDGKAQARRDHRRLPRPRRGSGPTARACSCASTGSPPASPTTISTRVMAAGPDGIMLPKAVGGVDVPHLGAKLAVREAEYGACGRRHDDHRHRDRDGARRLRARHACRREPSAAARLGRRGPRRPMSAPRRTGSGRRLHRPLPARPQPDAVRGRRGRGRRDRQRLHQLPRRDGLARRMPRQARRDGFTAKMAIHPAQVPVINEAFTPSAARRSPQRGPIVAAFAAEPRRRRRRHRRRDARPPASAPGRARAGAGGGDATLAGRAELPEWGAARARSRSRGRGGPGGAAGGASLEIKRGERGARLLPREPAASRERQDGKVGTAVRRVPTHPARDALGPWPRDFGASPALEGSTPRASAP